MSFRDHMAAFTRAGRALQAAPDDQAALWAMYSALLNLAAWVERGQQGDPDAALGEVGSYFRDLASGIKGSLDDDPDQV